MRVVFFNDTATTEIYTLSLHDALPIWIVDDLGIGQLVVVGRGDVDEAGLARSGDEALHRRDRFLCARHVRSEVHTSELQSRQYLVCRLLLVKIKPDSHPASPDPLLPPS